MVEKLRIGDRVKFYGYTCRGNRYDGETGNVKFISHNLVDIEIPHFGTETVHLRQCERLTTKLWIERRADDVHSNIQEFYPLVDKLGARIEFELVK